jgi:transposase-like protein
MYKRIDQEIKDRIIGKIKNEGLSVLDASKEFGVSAKAIYAWIGSKGRVEPGALEFARLRRENNALKQMIGQLMLDSDRGKKNN